MRQVCISPYETLWFKARPRKMQGSCFMFRGANGEQQKTLSSYLFTTGMIGLKPLCEVFLATLWNTEVTLQCFIMPSQNSSLQLNIQTPNCCTLIYPNFQAAGHSSSQNKFLLRMKWPALNFWWELRAEPTRCHSPPLKRWFGARFFRTHLLHEVRLSPSSSSLRLLQALSFCFSYP